MRESFLLLVMCTGIALFLYGIGMPLAWVIGLGIFALAVDFLFVRPTTNDPTEKKSYSTDKDARPLSKPVLQVIDEKSSDREQVPIYAAQSANHVGDSGVLDDREMSQATAKRVTRPSLAKEWEEGKLRVLSTPDTPTETPISNTPAQDIRPPDNPMAPNPLRNYQTEQFVPGRHSKPIEAPQPAAPTKTTSSPLGPAWEPPSTRHKESHAHRATGKPRPAHEALKPEDFQRNAGLKGYLYLARNPEHWEGLFKVGQTIRHPSKRVEELNKLHAEHKDIGWFELLKSVEVVDAYGAEQVMFQVLADLRPVPGREFFIASQDFLSRTMHAVAEFVRGRPDDLNRIYQDLNPAEFSVWPGRVARHNYRGVGRIHGWVYLARNQYHLANTYLFGVTSGNPDVVIRGLNEGQKEDTPQIGFYTVVFALPVSNTRASRTIGWRALSAWKLQGSRSYVRGPIEELCAALTSDLQATAG